MNPTTLEEANDLVLRAIGEADEAMILGFLPLSKTQEEAILELVTDSLLGGGRALLSRLLREFPAAMAYALAVAPSRSLTEGGRFWPALRDDLGLNVDVNQRSALSTDFCRICEQLGLLTGTLPDGSYALAAPFIFQSGILHYWKDALSAGLQQTLRHVPAPDLESETILFEFIKELRSHIRSQPLLLRTLESEVAPLLVRRLITAYLSDNWSILPPHLQDPVRQAFSAAGRGLVMRSPYVGFDPGFGQIELVLPAQSSRLANSDSYWLVVGARRHLATSETTIPASELPDGEIEIELRQLTGQLQNQRFRIDASFGGDAPFKIFRGDTGRERRVGRGSTIEIPPGDYDILVAHDVEIEGDEEFEMLEGFYRIDLELRPGDPPLRLRRGDDRWRVQAALQQGFYVDRDRSHVTLTEDGQRLHHGRDLGLVAYFPSENVESTQFGLSVCCPEAGLNEVTQIQSSADDGSVYRFQENLHDPIESALSKLPAGIHRIEVSLSHSNGQIRQSMWYWKGLDWVSEKTGFKCSDLPGNLDIHGCQGLEIHTDGVGFVPNFHAPYVTLALNSPKTALRIPRAGVQVTVREPGIEWEEDSTPETVLVVTSDDRRVLMFRSGGFQNWEILCNEEPIGTLDRSKTRRTYSLAGLATERGGSGKIAARCEDGTRVPLISFTRPLTATKPSLRTDHGRGKDTWSFSIPREGLYAVGVQVTDFSDQPQPNENQIKVLAERCEDGFSVEELHEGDGVIIAKVSMALAEDHWTNDITSALERATSENPPVADDGEFLHVKLTIFAPQLGDRFLTVDFLRKTSAEDEWIPLACEERHGYSLLRTVAWGHAQPQSDCGWWRRLRWAAQEIGGNQPMSELGEPLSEVSTEELDNALGTCSHLLDWKYPSSVWHECAFRINHFPVLLGKHCFSIWNDSSGIWWRRCASELTTYSATSLTPVTRQFLFGAQIHSLRTPRTQMSPKEGRKPQTPMERSLNSPVEIQIKGSLKEYVVAGWNSNELDDEVVRCYRNCIAVSNGRDDEFRDFSLEHFLKGGVAGVSGLTHRAERLNELHPRFRVEKLLSPEHLLHAIRALNRRTSMIDPALQREDENPIKEMAQGIELISRRIELTAPRIASELQWRGTDHLWTPPLLNNQWASKAAQGIWLLASISRLTANERLTPKDFEELLRNLLDHSTRSMKVAGDRICILLSLGPELFAFYVALFELMFSPKNPS